MQTHHLGFREEQRSFCTAVSFLWKWKPAIHKTIRNGVSDCILINNDQTTISEMITNLLWHSLHVSLGIFLLFQPEVPLPRIGLTWEHFVVWGDYNVVSQRSGIFIQWPEAWVGRASDEVDNWACLAVTGLRPLSVSLSDLWLKQEMNDWVTL